MKLLPGEVAATGWAVGPVREVLDELLAIAGDRGRPVVIALDGRGGAGKIVLAARLQAMVVDSVVAHTDDLAWHHSFFDWDDQLARHVLEPVRAGHPVRHRPLAWQERGREGAIEVPLLAQWQPWRRADVVVDATSTIPHTEDELVVAPPVR